MNAERRWIRLQEVGLSLLLAVPWAVYAAYLLGNPILIVLIPFAILLSGYCCFRWGYEKRVELRDKDSNKQGGIYDSQTINEP